MTAPDERGLDLSQISIDRYAEVPIGVQLAWALRARIHDGSFKPGQRLPGLRELAEATSVNINTVKAVYQRLNGEGLIDSQQGSGTFVAATRRRPSHVAAIAANAAHEAQETGVDPREVAAALYVSPEPMQASDPSAERRRLLRTQIAALERALGDIEAEYPGVAPVSTAGSRRPGPTLLGAEELEQIRRQLVRRLATVQAAVDDQAQTDSDGTPPAPKQRTAKRATATKAKRSPRPRATPGVALASS